MPGGVAGVQSITTAPYADHRQRLVMTARAARPVERLPAAQADWAQVRANPLLMRWRSSHRRLPQMDDRTGTV